MAGRRLFAWARRTPYLAGLPRDVAVLSFVAFSVALGYGIAAPVIPVYARTFGVSAFLATLVISGFALMRLVSAAPAGVLVDRYGERRVMSLGVWIVATSSLVTALAQDFTQLLVLRGLGGIGSAMFTVSAMALVLRTAGPEQRGRASGAFQAGFLFGGVLGPAVGGLVVGISIRAPFVVYGLTLAVAGLIAARYLSHEAGQARRSEAAPGPEGAADAGAAGAGTARAGTGADAGVGAAGSAASAGAGAGADAGVGAAGSAASAGAGGGVAATGPAPASGASGAGTAASAESESAQAGGVESAGAEAGTAGTGAVGATGTDAAGAGTGASRTGATAEPPEPKVGPAGTEAETAAVAGAVGESAAGAAGHNPAAGVASLGAALRSRAFRAALMVNLTVGFIIFGLRISLVPIYATEALGLAVGVVGLTFVVATGIQAVALIPAGRRTDSLGRRGSLLVGTVAMTTSMLVLIVVAAPVGLFVAMAASGLAMAFMGAPASAVVGDMTRGQSGGRVVSVFQMVGDLGGILGPLLAGALADALGFSWAFGAGLAVALVALALVVAMPETLRRSDPTPLPT